MRFEAFYPRAVDGAPVKAPAFRRSFKEPIAIGPGDRVIVIHYEGKRGGIFIPLRVAEATVRAKIEQGVTYIVDGRDEGDAVVAWIARGDTGTRITDEIVADSIPEFPSVIPFPIGR